MRREDIGRCIDCGLETENRLDKYCAKCEAGVFSFRPRCGDPAHALDGDRCETADLDELDGAELTSEQCDDCGCSDYVARTGKQHRRPEKGEPYGYVECMGRWDDEEDEDIGPSRCEARYPVRLRAARKVVFS